MKHSTIHALCVSRIQYSVCHVVCVVVVAALLLLTVNWEPGTIVLLCFAPLYDGSFNLTVTN